MPWDNGMVYTGKHVLLYDPLDLATQMNSLSVDVQIEVCTFFCAPARLFSNMLRRILHPKKKHRPRILVVFAHLFLSSPPRSCSLCTQHAVCKTCGHGDRFSL